MVFSSVIFLCFFLPIMIIGYLLLPNKVRNIWLLLGSLFFYAFGEPVYIFIMLASIIGNYAFGMIIHSTNGRDNLKLSKVFLVISVLYNLGILFYFKYFNLFMDTINSFLTNKISYLEVALPIGISFYTFQGMSYVIDIYRSDNRPDSNGGRTQLVQKNPLNLALYISMFPQLIAGPIVRYTDIKDFLDERKTDFDKIAGGLERFVIGLAKKAILANSIGELADKIFTAELSYMGNGVAWLGAICYTLQIYYDFSGYSDMAIGLGKVFGFDFCENFNYPYISKSITEFWRRWHISLSSWFKDYLYIPLGGNRKGNVYVNLLIVFIATGIWHGAAWGFLLWGLWHGLFMLIERAFRKRKREEAKQSWIFSLLKWMYTMLVVILGWVLFKLEEIPATLDYLKAMFRIKPLEYTAFSVRYYLDNKMIFILIIGILAAIPWKEVLKGRPARILNSISSEGTAVTVVRRCVLIILMLVCLLFIVNSTYNPFIYFRF